MFLPWSVGDRIWYWKNSDWILTASGLGGSAIEGVGVTNSGTE
jgi:hypothetical protein